MDANEKATTLEELIESKEYKESNHEFFELDGEYALKDYKTDLDEEPEAYTQEIEDEYENM